MFWCTTSVSMFRIIIMVIIPMWWLGIISILIIITWISILWIIPWSVLIIVIWSVIVWSVIWVISWSIVRVILISIVRITSISIMWIVSISVIWWVSWLIIGIVFISWVWLWIGSRNKLCCIWIWSRIVILTIWSIIMILWRILCISSFWWSSSITWVIWLLIPCVIGVVRKWFSWTVDTVYIFVW